MEARRRPSWRYRRPRFSLLDGGVLLGRYRRQRLSLLVGRYRRQRLSLLSLGYIGGRDFRGGYNRKFQLKYVRFLFNLVFPSGFRIRIHKSGFRIWIHKTFDDMNPDPVEKSKSWENQIFTPKILHFEIFYFYPNRTELNTTRVYFYPNRTELNTMYTSVLLLSIVSGSWKKIRVKKD